MVFQNMSGKAFYRIFNGRQLNENVIAISVVLYHFSYAVNLTAYAV
jgi:hypothetical protein